MFRNLDFVISGLEDYLDKIDVELEAINPIDTSTRLNLTKRRGLIWRQLWIKERQKRFSGDKNLGHYGAKLGTAIQNSFMLLPQIDQEGILLGAYQLMKV